MHRVNLKLISVFFLVLLTFASASAVNGLTVEFLVKPTGTYGTVDGNLKICKPAATPNISAPFTFKFYWPSMTGFTLASKAAVLKPDGYWEVTLDQTWQVNLINNCAVMSLSGTFQQPFLYPPYGLDQSGDTIKQVVNDVTYIPKSYGTKPPLYYFEENCFINSPQKLCLGQARIREWNCVSDVRIPTNRKSWALAAAHAHRMLNNMLGLGKDVTSINFALATSMIEGRMGCDAGISPQQPIGTCNNVPDINQYKLYYDPSTSTNGGCFQVLPLGWLQLEDFYPNLYPSLNYNSNINGPNFVRSCLIKSMYDATSFVLWNDYHCLNASEFLKNAKDVYAGDELFAYCFHDGSFGTEPTLREIFQSQRSSYINSFNIAKDLATAHPGIGTGYVERNRNNLIRLENNYAVPGGNSRVNTYAIENWQDSDNYPSYYYGCYDEPFTWTEVVAYVDEALTVFVDGDRNAILAKAQTAFNAINGGAAVNFSDIGPVIDAIVLATPVYSPYQGMAGKYFAQAENCPTPGITIKSNSEICPGEIGELWVHLMGLPPFNYSVISPSGKIYSRTGVTLATDNLKIDEPGVYRILSFSDASGKAFQMDCNINDVEVKAKVPVAATASVNYALCPNPVITASGNPSGVYKWYTAKPSLGGTFLASGTTYTATPGSTVWVEPASPSTTVNINDTRTTNAYGAISTHTTLIVANGSEATINSFRIPYYSSWAAISGIYTVELRNASNVVVGSPVSVAKSHAAGTATAMQYANFTPGWTVPAGTYTVFITSVPTNATHPSLVTTNFNSSGNEIQLSDGRTNTFVISVSKESSPIACKQGVSVVVNSCSGCTTPVAPTPAPVSYCQNATATALTATGSNLLWYTAATGGTGSDTAPTPNTATAGSTTYYVSQTVTGCESPRASLIVTINPLPVAPASAPVTYCQNATATALTAMGTNLLWYTAATGGTGSATAPTPNTASAGTTTYYVSQTVSSCESPRASLVVTVTALPIAPTTAPVSYCINVAASPLTATGINLLWYNAATGGTGSVTAPNPSTASVGTINYYVSQTIGSCESPRATIVVTVNSTLTPPTTSPVEYCRNSTASALTAGGSNLLWYTSSSGGIGNASAPTPITTNVGSTTYYVSQTSGSCESPRASIVVTINAIPNITPSATDETICSGSTVAATTWISDIPANIYWASNTNASLQGYSTTGTNSLPAQTIVNNSLLQQEIIYSAIAISTQSCTSAVSTKSIKVDPMDTASLQGNSPYTFCANDFVMPATLPSVGTVIWTKVSGQGNISNPVLYNTTINGMNSGESGVFELTVTSGVCSSKAQATVSRITEETPAVTLSADKNTVCFNGSVQFTASASGIFNGLYQFVDENNQVLQANSNSNTFLLSSITSSKQVKVIYTTNSTCLSAGAMNTNESSLLNIQVESAGTVSIPQNHYSCEGNSEDLSTVSIQFQNTPTNYQWEVNTGSGFQAINPLMDPKLFLSNLDLTMDQYQYRVTAYTASSCVSYSNTMTLQVRAPIQLSENLNDISLCAGETLTIEPKINVPNQDVSFQWYKDNNLLSATGAVYTKIAATKSADDGEYKIRIADLRTFTVQGCPSIEPSIDVIVHTGGQETLHSYSNNVCAGEQVELYLNSALSSNYTWIFDAHAVVIQQSSTNAIIQVNATTKVQVQTNGACNASNKLLELTIYAVSSPTVSLGEDIYLEELSTVLLQAKSSTGFNANHTFQWTSSDGWKDTTVVPQTNVTPEKTTTTYIVFVSNSASAQCSSSDTIQVIIERKLIIPNIFTPNEDGNHDLFVIKNLEDYPLYELILFNQWGDQLWKTNGSENKKWDGKKHGADMPAGVYFYTLNLNNKKNTMYTGHINLIR